MANAYAAVGLASGLQSGLARNRQQSLDEEARKRQLALDQRTMGRQDQADRFAAEDQQWQREDRVRQSGLRDAEATKKAADQVEADRVAQGQALYSLSVAAEEGGDPAAFIEFSRKKLPPGISFDANTNEIVLPGADGATPQRFKAKQLRAGLEPAYGKPKADYNLSPGERRISGTTGKVVAEGAPKAADGASGFSIIGQDPTGRPIGHVGKSATLVYGDTFEKVGSAGAGGVRPLTATEERLRRNAFRTALDTRTKDQFGPGSTLNGIDKQRYGVIADRVLRKYGTATPGEDDIANIIHTKMSTIPSQRALRDIEVKRRVESGEAVRSTGLFGGVDEEGTKKAADETAKIQREAMLKKAEAEVEQEIDDIARTYYGYGAQPGAAPARSSAPAGVDGNPLW